MSFKLVDKIKKSNLPGPMKKVLEAYVSFGNSDGTSIRPTAAAVGKRATCSSRTVERQTPALVRLGLLVHDKSEDGTYKTHNYPKNGVWAYVYHVDLSPLDNRAVVEGFEMHRQAVSSARRRARGKGNRSRQLVLFEDIKMAETATDKLSESLPVILSETTTDNLSDRPYPYTSSLRSSCDQTQTYPSAVSTAEIDSKPESPSLATLATAPTAPAKEQDQPRTALGLVAESENPKALELLRAISPNLPEPKVREQLPIAAEILASLPEHMEATELLHWNRLHRGGKYASQDDKALYIRTTKQFLAAINSDEAYLLNDYETHDFFGCETCRNRNLHNPMDVWKEKQRAVQQAAAEEAAEQRLKAEREAAEAAWQENKDRWSAYTWNIEPTTEQVSTFRAHCHFDQKEAKKYWAERRGLMVCRNAAVIHFASQDEPITREDFDWLMDDLHAAYEYRRRV